MLRVPSVIGEEQSGHTGGVPAPAVAVRRPPVVSRRIHALQASSVHFHTGTLMRCSARGSVTDEAVRAGALPGLLLTRAAALGADAPLLARLPDPGAPFGCPKLVRRVSGLEASGGVTP
jgi:hypothetical protein